MLSLWRWQTPARHTTSALLCGAPSQRGVNEVQRVDVKVGPAKFSGKELKLASQLIDMLSGKFQPEKFQDEYQKNVEQLIEQKQKGERVHAPKYERPAPVVDILKALQQSLAKSKATPKQAGAPARRRKHKAA